MELSTFQLKGYQVLNGLYTPDQILNVRQLLEGLDLRQAFGVRQILRRSPELAKVILTPQLKSLIRRIQPRVQVIRSIYFNKPPQANWIVNWHQDLTINLRQKITYPGFKNWRVLKDRVVTQPPMDVLNNMFTLRVHLDDCNEQNGALRVIPGSHKAGIIDVRNGVDQGTAKEQICEVSEGGVLIMKPLLLHSSRRTENLANRRVIHMEFSDFQLPNDLDWLENIPID